MYTARRRPGADIENAVTLYGTCAQKKEPTNSNAVTRNTFVKQVISTLLYILPLLPYQYRLWSLEWGGVQSVERKDSAVLSGECSM